MTDAQNDFPYRTSFWSPESVEPRDPLGANQLGVDVVVIGGGYAGLSCAYYTKKARPDLKVALIEADYVGYGPSGRNFGGVAPGVRELRAAMVTPGDIDEERFMVQWYLKGRDELERRIAEAGFECEYRNEPIMMQALDDMAWQAMLRESEILTERGTPHKLFDTAALRAAMSLPYEPVGAIVRTAWRAVQPFKLARGFGEQLRSMGVIVHEATRVSSVEDDGSSVVIRTDDGGTITAAKAVLATNAYTMHLDKFAEEITPRHTFVIATEILDEGVYASLGFDEYKFVEDSGFVFYYARVYQGRLLFGGGEPTTGFFTPSNADRDADRKPAEYARLYDEMVRRWPQLAGVKVDTVWGGPIDMTENFAPKIRLADGMPNVTLCIGYNGEGLVSGNLSGKLAISCILGEEYADPDAERVRQYLAQPLG